MKLAVTRSKKLPKKSHRRTRTSLATFSVGVLSASLLAAAGTVVTAPAAHAGPCSNMFGNFGSLLENQTGAGMADGSLGSSDSLGSEGASGSLGSSDSAGSSDSVGSDARGPLGSAGSADHLGSTRDNPIIRDLETGSLGNGLTRTLGSVGGSLYNMPPWYTGEDGTVPVLDGPTEFLQLVTGPTSPNETMEQYSISGTDLGIMWDNGDSEDPQTLFAFGDTMGDCSTPDNEWRSNVLLRSKTTELENGLEFNGAARLEDGVAQSLIPRDHMQGEVTKIPTAGISVNGVQYLRFMSVANWGVPGSWDTNYSGMAYSTDDGESWNVMPHMNRQITDKKPAGENAPDPDEKWFNAQMSSFVHGEDDDYLYEYLTPSGRQGAAILARVDVSEAPSEDDMEGVDSEGSQAIIDDDSRESLIDPEAYEFYDGSEWVDDIENADEVLPRQVSELSVMYNDHLGKYMSMYTSGINPIVVRTSDSPEGPWSDATTLIGPTVLPGTYGGYMHPQGVDGNNLYYLVTTWNSYNVFLVRTDLKGVGITPDSGPSALRTGGGAGPVEDTEVVRQIPVGDLPGGGMVPTE